MNLVAHVYRLMVHALGAHLVFGDEDRRAVLEALAGAYGERLLAYSLLDERLDVVVEGLEADARGRMDEALRAYLRERASRSAVGRPGLPARIEAVHLPDPMSVGLAINDVHELPLRVGWG